MPLYLVRTSPFSSIGRIHADSPAHAVMKAEIGAHHGFYELRRPEDKAWVGYIVDDDYSGTRISLANPNTDNSSSR